ncbi:DMT family transporter [Clostridium paraputrificum]|uniref:DMT family transporter n=1 Tax=Clostridium TaxID=1485 RepID=UPI003D357745
MMPIIFAIISGIAMSLQGVFNTRLGEKIGIWETNVLVQASGLILTLIIAFFLGKGSYRELRDVNKLYLLGGALGVIIIFTVMKSIGGMGATYGIGIILVAQLLAAALIDAFGLFDSQKVNFSIKEILGVAIMVIGIIVFKWKH